MYKDIIAIDFDGTIANQEGSADGTPDLSKPIVMVSGADAAIKGLYDHGYELILWTVRENLPGKNEQYLTSALNWLKENDLYYYFFAINAQGRKYRHHPIWGRGIGRKIYADYYIDDKIVGGFPGWIKILYDLTGRLQ